jgi:hypothetical protein
VSLPASRSPPLAREVDMSCATFNAYSSRIIELQPVITTLVGRFRTQCKHSMRFYCYPLLGMDRFREILLPRTAPLFLISISSTSERGCHTGIIYGLIEKRSGQFFFQRRNERYICCHTMVFCSAPADHPVIFSGSGMYSLNCFKEIVRSRVKAK